MKCQKLHFDLTLLAVQENANENSTTTAVFTKLYLLCNLPVGPLS